MEKFVPIEKMSKRARRELQKARRGSWGAICPVTRRPPNPKAYDRKKARREEKSFDAGPSYLFRCFAGIIENFGSLTTDTEKQDCEFKAFYRSAKNPNSSDLRIHSLLFFVYPPSLIHFS